MENKVFVGGLPWAVDDEKLREVFSAYGEITEANVVTDKFTNRSRGFGFVTFATAEEAQASIDALNETEMDGRTITVNIAKPKER